MTATRSAPFHLFEGGLLSAPGLWEHVVDSLDESSWAVNDRRSRNLWDAMLRRVDYPSVLARMRATIAAVDDERPIIVIGHSIGCLLARAHANALGGRVAGLVLVDPAAPTQFAAGADQVYQYVRLKQSLAVQAARTVLRMRPSRQDLVDPDTFPKGCRAEVGRLILDSSYWVDGYREAKSSGVSWLSAALFPDIEPRPVAVVSSSVATDPHSIQAQFEEKLLYQSISSRRFHRSDASHQSVITDPSHSRVVNEAIEWVTERVAS